MKGPDRFQVAASQATEWMGKHRRGLTVGLAAAAVALVGAVGAHAAIRSSRERAGGALYRALDAADGQISPVPLPGVDRPVFKTDEERQKAVVEAADRVRKEHGGTASARTAALAAGDAHLALRQWDSAAADFQEYLAGAAADDPLRFAALDGLARAQEGKGDLAAAAQTFERAGREVSFYRDRAAIERARVLARAGKADEARKILQGFPEEFKDSALRGEAQERLARLGGK
jgi:predicted negative regulator of RcsB-dependent stress response